MSALGAPNQRSFRIHPRIKIRTKNRKQAIRMRVDLSVFLLVSVGLVLVEGSCPDPYENNNSTDRAYAISGINISEENINRLTGFSDINHLQLTNSSYPYIHSLILSFFLSFLLTSFFHSGFNSWSGTLCAASTGDNADYFKWTSSSDQWINFSVDIPTQNINNPLLVKLVNKYNNGTSYLGSGFETGKMHVYLQTGQ